jgi:hypothetical protein
METQKEKLMRSVIDLIKANTSAHADQIVYDEENIQKGIRKLLKVPEINAEPRIEPVPEERKCSTCGNGDDPSWCDWNCRDASAWKSKH